MRVRSRAQWRHGAPVARWACWAHSTAGLLNGPGIQMPPTSWQPSMDSSSEHSHLWRGEGFDQGSVTETPQGASLLPRCICSSPGDGLGLNLILYHPEVHAPLLLPESGLY